MSASKVYFTNLRARPGDNLLQKLNRLLRTAGMDTIDFDGKFAVIKIHFGEPGNMSYIRPNYAKVVVDFIKERGGMPYLTDCNTLYVGGRKNALEHMESAYANGFNPFQVGCHIMIADGLKGSDEAYVPVEGGVYVKEAKIGRALMDADIIISLNHFKGHESTGFGGALKNLGMGGGSRAGKMEMHSAGKPWVRESSCVGCGSCMKICAHGAPIMADRKVTIAHDKCVGCGRCIAICPKDAIRAANDESNDILNCKIAEYAKAVINGRPGFHINLVMNISPNCDCHGENDYPIVPDVGMFASFDPVALDTACADAVNAMPVNEGSMLFDNLSYEHPEGCSCADCGDHFKVVHPETNWRSCVEHGEKLGIGVQAYELIEVK